MAYKSKTTKTRTTSKTGSKALSGGGSGKATASPTRSAPTSMPSKSLSRGGSGKATTSKTRSSSKAPSRGTSKAKQSPQRASGRSSSTGGQRSFRSSTTRPMGGRSVDVKAEPEKAKILQGNYRLAKTQSSLSLGDKNNTTAQDARNFLHMLGICQNTSMDADFSLINVQTATEMLANPNIFDSTRERNRQKTFPSGEDKFPVVDDPFYEADETPIAVASGALEEQAKAGVLEVAVPLAADLANINMNTSDALSEFVVETTPTAQAVRVK